MKNYPGKALMVFLVIILFLSACSGSRSMHHRGVNNRSFRGY